MALPEELSQVLEEHRKELLDHLDAWLRSFEPARPSPKKGLSDESLKWSAESPDMSHVTHFSTQDQPVLSSERSRSKELSDYERAHQAHSKVVADFAQMQSVSEMEEKVRGRPFREALEAVVESHWFGSFFLFMVVTNSILIGASLEMQAVQGEAFAGEEFLLGINTFYAAMFSIEAAMRLAAKGVLSYVWASQDWSWNWLDIFVVISSWVELLIDLAGNGETVGGTNTNLRVFRLLRVGRLVRVVRVVRVVKFFRSLRTLVRSLVGTLKALVWSMVLLAMIMYIFAILFTDTVLGQMRVDPVNTDQRLQIMFGTLYSSIATLYRSISNGITWGDAADALESIPGGVFWVQVLNFYIAFCSFAVLNVMTGVFCNSAIKAAERDHEMQIMSLVQTRRELREQVEFLFKKLDPHGRGKVTIADFESKFGDETVMAFFESMEISAMDAWTLFLTLDIDGDHTVGVDEFVERCLQLHGPARSTDLFALRQQTEKLVKQWGSLMDGQRQVERQVTQLSRSIASLPTWQEEPKWI